MKTVGFPNLAVVILFCVTYWLSVCYFRLLTVWWHGWTWGGQGSRWPLFSAILGNYNNVIDMFFYFELKVRFWSSDNMLFICLWCLPQFHLPTSGPSSAETPGWIHPRHPPTPHPSPQYVLQCQWIEIRFFISLFHSPHLHNTLCLRLRLFAHPV